jgi:hypothetical protein
VKIQKSKGGKGISKVDWKQNLQSRFLVVATAKNGGV